MAKSLGNISYNEIVKNRDKVVRREGISREIFNKLVFKMDICGFENDDDSVTAYFNSDDISKFDSVANDLNSHFDFKKIDEIIGRLDSLDGRLTQIYDITLKSQSERGWEEDIKIINERLDSMAEYISEYCSIINEIKNSISNNRPSTGKAIVEAHDCGGHMDELINRFDELHGDMIRNIAYLRSDLKIKRKRSFSKKKEAFFIYIFGALSAAAILIIFKKFIPGWFL